MPFERGKIAQVIVKRHAGVVDEDIEGFDPLDSGLNLRHVRDVQGQGRDAPIQVDQRLARTRIHPFRPSSQGFLDQRLSDTAVGPGDQNCFICDSHIAS